MIKDFKDYIPELQEKFPMIPTKVLEEILHVGIMGVQYLVNRDHDINIDHTAKAPSYRLKMIRSKARCHDRNSRAKRNYFRLRELRQKRNDAASY